MPSKLQTYMQMADEAQRQITGSYRGWTGFLTTAARLYKYPYAEQVMIHAQRPDATACAEYDFWNEKMGRYVRRGSKGIALIDSSGERPRLRYVFDVSDTGGREFPKSHYLWEYRAEHADAVSVMLESRYGVDGKGGLPDQLERIASQLAEEYWRDYKRDILAIVDDSFLYGYDEFNVGAAFQSAAAVSIAYSLMSRCGLEEDDRFEHEDFLSIFDFNTPEAAAELGTAVSRINGEVLRQIEVTIKNYEREKLAERSHSHDRADLHQERGLPDSRPDAERDAGGRETPGQVRETAQELPSGAQTGAVQPSGAVGEAVPASAGDRRDGEPEAGADDAGADEVGGRDGGAESPRPDEMGGADEQPESAGRGDHPQRAGVQLTNDAPEAEPAQPPIPQAYQLSLFPTEEEQIAYIAEAESYTLSAFSMSIPQSDIDHILRMEGNADYARMKIATEFSKGKSAEEIAAFLQSSFHGGNGVVTENGRYSAWYAEDGIHIANGDAARYLTSAKVVSWQEAAERIGQLLTQGEYATNVELAEAPGHERTELAQSIWYLRQDLSEKARAQGYLSCLSDMRGGGFPEETARLAGRLRDPAFREVLMDDFAQFRSDYREDRSLLRFHYHKPDKIEQGLRELSLPRREYRAEMVEIPAVQRFITEDEIAATLTRGSNIEGSKGRIYAYFKEKHTPREQADFLKDEYGIGGSSHAVSGASHSGEDHSGKGVSLKKQDCPDVQLKWSKVASRISELIRKDRFLTPEEKTQYEQFQREKDAERELPAQAQNEYNAIKEAHPDNLVLFQVGDFFELYGEDAKQAAELLEINLTTRNIPGAGRVEMCGVPSHNLEMYVEKLRDKYDVTIAEAPDFRGERHIYTLRSVDHEAEAAIDAYEAEFGADGTRVFRDPAAVQPQPTVAEMFEQYKLTVGNTLVANDAFLNACRNSDRQNAYLEGAAAIRRIVMASEDLQLTRLYFDMPSFHNRLHQELLDELYPTLATTVTPSPYKVTQADIDAALQQWNGRIESKHAVVRYMKAHARDRDTAVWLAREYGLKDTSKPLQISVGNSEPVTLSWAKVQRRIAQLIQSDNFYTEQEQDNFDNIDPIAIREALAERGIVNGQIVDAEANRNSPFIRQVMADVERIAAQERKAQQEEPAFDPADRFHVVSLDRGFRTLYAVWDDDTHGYHVDADGVTEEFTSEWQAEAYRLELQGQAEQALMERAKGLISDFCRSEYGSEADFSNPAKIGVAYTTVTDDEIPIQVNIDLVNYRLERYLDDEHLETRQYASLQELISNELENLDFSDLIHVSDEDVEQYRWHAPEEAVEEAPGTAPVPQREPFPYSVGDTVYLENGKPYIIESIGVFDITLSDPTLFYPISRAESRESFARLMERYPQPEKEPAYTEETVAVYPANKNNLPYDVEIRTLRFDEPEHDPPSAEPAEPEPPAMSEEEALILEQEGRAALSEMGEFVPDFDDAISQAEIDEPPTHRHAVSISIDGEWQGFPSADAAEQAAYADFNAASHRNAQNFHITDDALGVGGAKAKFRANMAAINLLKELEFEGLQASPEQQEILSRYVGWGGLADAFDESKDNWKDEFAELYAALSPEEYAAARASTLNAHYTSPTVIRAIYDAVENMGFQTGNILEPSMGVGNFFGMLPESMKSSRLYGVELDSITGRIAKQLYPKADITVAGFETTDRKDFYDLAVGNVPFGQYQVSDRAFDKLGFSIHNYFFAKALEQVRPGGVVAFVTSRYTMDAKDSAARKYIAQRADFLGAIRLPNNAFRANAGTDVVSDIIFLQKRDRPIEIEPDWVHTGIWRNPGANADGFAINQYFIDHPEMVLGRQTSESTQYGRQDFTVAPIEGADLAEQLSGAIRNIRGTYAEAELPDLGEDETIVDTIPADPNVRNFSYTVVDGELYYRQNSIMTKPDFNATAKERAKGMVELRDCVQKLISQQMDGFISDETIRQTQAELNTLYDGFTAKYGLINSRANALAFAEDSSYYLLCSLEELDEDKNLKRKADMFTRRTIRAHEAVTSVDTASEALALSISEKACVDMAYMAQLTGKSQDELINELNGVIFLDPVRGEWQTADEYLSGNVRQKLREAEQAAQDSPGYLPNVEALRQAQPRDLDASEIEVRLGATWIDPSYIREFMWETFETPFYQQRMIDVTYSAFTAEWNIRNKNAVSYSNIAAYMTYGTERANAYKILEDTLNLRDVRIYDTKHDADGRERRVLNSKETTLSQQKQQAIRDAFRDWIWRDPDRRHTLVARYNELFNSTRPREYDGSHITFAGMNPEIRLREHQLNAVAHVLYGGNTLLAHEVGAGKTFEMVAAAMESKRLGLCHKSLFVVPNHLTEQWSGEFLRLYPSANILVATKKDFEPKNRKKFCARIATGEYDAVIIGHSQFEKIPVSMERQQRLLAEQIFEVEEGLRELKSQRAERFTIKSLERTKRGLEAKLKKLQDSSRKDDVVTFEQLGVDRLYVDEAHNYKNLFLYTKMRNVAGLSATDAQKSSDMLLKCRYIDEITDSRGVVFATGTPVSNSMTELYTMMRYLQHDAIRGKGLAHFDCWASTFGETQTAIELAPEGTGYRARTRFAKFFNLPELMTLFKEAADIKTSDQLNLPTPTPIYHNEVAQPTEIQKQMVQELSERAARVHAQLVDPGTDNMLKITSDGRKLGLDQRIINPDLPDDPNSKVNRCVDNIHRIWQDGQADKLTQLVFCDLSTPKTGATGAKAAKTAGGNLDSPELNALEAVIGQDAAEEPGFTVYDDIREKLVARGIPREQIAFIHEANTETRKKELFAKVRSGQVRVLMGSTFKMGAGMNVQDRLVALHDLDCPWRPGDLEQRSGRIIRQGNRNKEVHIYRYVTESTFDAYLWQTVENKQKFISQIMTSKSPVRSCEDVDETALSYAEIKALCAGDKRIKEKMDLDVDVARLKLMKASHQSQQFRLEDNLLRHFPEQIRQNESFVEGFTADMQTLSAHPHPMDGFAGMEVKGDLLTDKDNAGAAILEAFKNAKGMEPVPIGSYRGFAMSLTVEDFGRHFVLTLKGRMNHRVTLGKDARGNLTRIDNALNAMSDRLQNVRNTLDALTAQMETAKAELGKPFPQEDELRTKSARLAELNAELNIDDRTPMEQMAEDAPAVQSAKAERPSVLAKLKAPLSQPCAEDKIRHRGKEER